MEHDRIATLLSATPSGLPEPRPRPDLLLPLFRRRRARRLAAATVATSLAVAGLAVPLALLGGIGGPAHTPGPAPLASGPSSTTAPPATGGPSPSSGGVPDVGVFRCTSDGIETDTPRFAVQPDGVHLQVLNPGHSNALVIHGVEPPLSRLPIDLLGSDGTEFVTPFLEPGTYRAGCEASSGDRMTGPFVRGESVIVHIVDPSGIWSVIDLPCADTTERVILVGAGVDDRSQVSALIRRGVNGIGDADVIVPAGYPQSDEDIAYVVQRDARNVAVVRALGRATPLAQALDVTSCDGSGIGDGQGGR